MLSKNTIKTIIKILEDKKEHLNERKKILITMYADLGMEEEQFNEDITYIINEQERTVKEWTYWKNQCEIKEED